MKRCTASALNSFSFEAARSRLPICQRRCRSYKKHELDQRALLDRVNSSFGEDTYATPLSVDAEKKTISTAEGDLPISPLFDPSWIQARRRKTKEAPSPTGRFRKKLQNNPYAQALATPVRRCAATHASLPRYFLQDFEAVKHPESGEGWWAPGPLSFEHVRPQYTVDPKREETESTSTDVGQKPAHVRPSRAPITTYAVCRKNVMDLADSANKKFAGALIGPRTGMAVTPDVRDLTLAKDMSSVLLGMMRRHAVDALVQRSSRPAESRAKFLHKCATWEDIKGVTARGCVLWVPEGQGNASAASYATFDVDGAAYDGKLAVHDLRRLLGSEELARLQREAHDMFADGSIVVLRLWKSRSMQRLHLLLWRLQGYLAEKTKPLE